MTPEQQALSEKLTNLQRLTVLGVVAGKSQRQAYYDAGGKANTDDAADVSVSRMLSDARVRAFHDSLLADAVEEAQITLKTLLAELEEARQAALGKGEEKSQAAAMVAATMGKAKLLGLEAPTKVANTDSQGNDVPPTRIVIEAAKFDNS